MLFLTDEIRYEIFLQNKSKTDNPHGFHVDSDSLPDVMFAFQTDIVIWALAKGRAAIFADCGLGKTLMQLSWAQQVARHTSKPVLILAPLAVAHQTYEEGARFGIPVTECETDSDVSDGINITNYEKLDRFDTARFAGIVLDESSILKSFTGKVRTSLIGAFRNTPYRLACTATPAPNDYMELGNHSEFLGVQTRGEMLAEYFVHDGGDTAKWRLKGHAEKGFWDWMSSWAVVLDNPKNIGYECEGYDLPALHVHDVLVDGDTPSTESLTLTQRRQARKETLPARCAKAAEIANSTDGQVLIWCDLNAESELLHKLTDDSEEVRGSDKPEKKTERLQEFSDGAIRCLVTKPRIAGFGMNWQNCHTMIFVGLSDSYEQYYQAVRRCWRFGQEQDVDVFIVTSTKEGCVRDNIERKRRDAEQMKDLMMGLTRENVKKNLRTTRRIMSPYLPDKVLILPAWPEMKGA